MTHHSTVVLLTVWLLGCADGRSLVSLRVTSAGLSGIDHLHLQLSDSAGRMSQPVDLPLADQGGAIPPDRVIALGFGSSVNGTVHMTVDAIDAAGDTLSSGSVDVDVHPSSKISGTLTLGTQATDLGAVDFAEAPPDLAGIDLAGAKMVGAACLPTDTCVTGLCVDGYCCDRSCQGQCEACDVHGAEGACSRVSGDPHGARTPCTSDGTACGGTCNGNSATACFYPTTACQSAVCSAGNAKAAANCAAGVCPSTTTHCPLNGCDGNSCLTVTQLATGGTFSCALLSDKTVRCWGQNTFGQLGQGENDVMDRHTPSVVNGLTNVSYLASSEQGFVCAIIGDGSIQCWGQNNRGQLGTGEDPASVPKHGSPHAVQNLGGSASKIALGLAHICAIVGAAGNVQCWGRNIEGEIGDSASSPSTPVLAPAYVCAAGSTGTGCTHMSGAVEIACGAVHSCARLMDNTVYCWGGNQEAQLGNGSAADSNPHPDPTQFGPLDDLHQLSGVGENISCVAYGGNLTLYCSGENGFNQLGLGTADSNYTHTPPAPGNLNNIAALSTATFLAPSPAEN